MSTHQNTTQLYIHLISGDVASIEDWRADYESMDIESWHGKPAEECDPNNWIEDGKLCEYDPEDNQNA